ncbi:MurR/RpiR family transcriptional regulator [Bifidobacterium aquikefiri]|uniref:MurR/RpiR family transcriptional regulator n=1 Tax=Bifidobacterium aquikefiri TaxID=1653207 RepID=UPI0039E77050
MEDTENDFSDMKLRSAELTPLQRKISELVINKPEIIATATVSTLARDLGMNQSTITRFAEAAGFKGFSHMRDYCRLRMRKRNGMLERFLSSEKSAGAQSQSRGGSGGNAGETEQTRNISAQLDRNAIATTFSSISNESWSLILSTVSASARVGVIGLRQSEPVAALCAYLLGLVRSNVVELSDRYGVDLDTLNGFDEHDCIIAISTYPCSAATVKATQWAEKSRIPVIAITDEGAMPLFSQAWKSIIADTTSNSALSSMTAVFAVVQALAGDIALADPKKTASHLQHEESIIRQFGVYAE